MKTFAIIMTQFTLGGLAYCGIEVAFRGYTHPSMLFAGGLCFVLLCLLARSRFGLLTAALFGGLVITVVELAVGGVVNLWLGLEVWDYSQLPLNLWGQICLYYTLIWSALGGFVILVARISRGAVLLYIERKAKLRIPYE
jgi:uncharacterized membrane protein